MPNVGEAYLRAQLEARRGQLEQAFRRSGESAYLAGLLQEVDTALCRLQAGTYGLCAECHEPIEKERLIADPLVSYCLDHLTPAQQRALKEDLELAARIQNGLLPKQRLALAGWEAYHYYEPAGPVSGDYCDIVTKNGDRGELFFILGDVSGKGVAACLLMAHLRAIVRSLLETGVSVAELAVRANRIFCESIVAGYFATSVCGTATGSGEVEICNAGHCPPLLVRGGEVTSIEATGLPLGMFSEGEYSVRTAKLAPGDSLFLYSDGLSEAQNPSGAEYGGSRLMRLLAARHQLRTQSLVAACLDDLNAFRSGAPKTDDVTIMILQREG
jgi:sigma-B regulation protein RsbU (phosphoserine phosphatase)